MFRTGLRILIVVVIGLVCGVLGLASGALIGGNYAERFVFNGVRGYEATGQIGFLLGALLGVISGWRLLLAHTPSGPAKLSQRESADSVATQTGPEEARNGH